jgi:hypothetical protein
LQIPLNSYQYLKQFFFQKKNGVFWEFWQNLTENSNEMLKLKDRYPKLTLFKVWVHFFKNDERSGVISEVLPKEIISKQTIKPKLLSI